MNEEIIMLIIGGGMMISGISLFSLKSGPTLIAIILVLIGIPLFSGSLYTIIKGRKQ